MQGKATLRCELYEKLVKGEAESSLSPTFPWWYNLGQLQQESKCRADITAFDGGMGLAQVMEPTLKVINTELKETLDPYKPADAIKIQATLLRDLQKGCNTRLWVVYQAYNGGCALLRKEAVRAGGWEHDRMLLECKRKVLVLKSGAKLSLCQVNYAYSTQVKTFGEAYRNGPDSVLFW